MSTGKNIISSPNSHIARQAAVIGLATLCSRLLGFIRDMVIARMFGVYVYAQAFVIAFRIPNLLRDFLAEGATNAALVPVFSEYNIKKNKAEFWELANVVLNLLLVVAGIATILGIIFSPLIVRLIAPGFVLSPEKFAATVRLNRIIFPYILLISLAAYSMGILNSLKHFAVPAFAPCLLNISIIIFALLFGEGTTGLALGVLVGGLLQLAIQLPVLYRKGFRPQLFRSLAHPELKVIGRLMLPRVASSSIYQLNNFVDSIFGSLAWIVGEGGVAVLYFSYRLIQFPLGVFSTALSQAALPTFSTQVAQGSHGELKQTLEWSLRATFLLMLPACVGFIVLGKPIVYAVFGGGKFDSYSVNLTAAALSAYSVGLFAYAANKILQSCFFALKDTLTPTKVSGICLAVNVVLNALFIYPFKVAGIAFATSISGIGAFFILFMALRKKIGILNIRQLLISFNRILLASLFMGFVCYLVFSLGGNLPGPIGLILAVLSGIASYPCFCLVLGSSEIKGLYQWLLKKK